MTGIISGLLTGGLLLFAALPGTGNYELRDYGFGAGGSSGSGTSNYSLEGIAGELSAQDGSTANYGLKEGLLGMQLAALPDAPVFQNPDDWYNKLELIINPTGNPSDTLFAVAVSDDSFATTQYVQSDDTLGSSLGTEDFRDYAGWGGATGMEVIGLNSNTTYDAKVKAAQGDFTETAFGPQASASTSQASLVFDIDIDANDTESAAPYQLSFGDAVPDTVIDSQQLIWLDIDSNAESGTHVYITSENNGLFSDATSHTISSYTGDLGSANEGVGAQNVSVTQSGGGPLSAVSPYSGAGANVGAIGSSFQQLLTSNGPLNGGRASFILKIKTTPATPAANDYLDIYTVIATAAF